MNSPAAASEARNAFDEIFNVSFSWIDKRIDHAWARVARYARTDISDQLAAKLAQ